MEPKLKFEDVFSNFSFGSMWPSSLHGTREGRDWKVEMDVSTVESTTTSVFWPKLAGSDSTSFQKNKKQELSDYIGDLKSSVLLITVWFTFLSPYSSRLNTDGQGDEDRIYSIYWC